MKILKIVMLALFATVTMNAQNVVENHVPNNFTEGLLKVYPKAADIEWERINDNYKVQFIDGNLEHIVHFNKKGDRVRIEAKMVKTELPITLADAINKDYSDYIIDSVTSITKNDVTTYEVVLQKRDWVEEISLRYNISGKVLSVNKY